VVAGSAIAVVTEAGKLCGSETGVRLRTGASGTAATALVNPGKA